MYQQTENGKAPGVDTILHSRKKEVAKLYINSILKLGIGKRIEIRDEQQHFRKPMDCRRYFRKFSQIREKRDINWET